MTDGQGSIKSLIGRLFQAIAGIGGRRFRKILSWLRLTLVLAILAVTLSLIAAQLIGLKRSFVIEARSSLLDLVFTGNFNNWQFDQVIICRPADSPDPREAANPDAPCPDNIYEISKQTDYTIEWPDHSGVRLTLDPDGTLVVETGRDFPFLKASGKAGNPDREGEQVTPPGLPAGTLILVPAKAWFRNAALTFEGAATIGQDIRSGVRHYLHEGRWEARQTALFTWWLRQFTEVIKDGHLHHGVEVTVVDDKKIPVKVFGHVAPFLGGDLPAVFTVVALSEPGRTELRLGQFGLRDPAIVRPDLLDLASSSAIFVAAFAVLTILAALTQILSDLFARHGKGNAASRAKSEKELHD
ncbi:hypothetical protein [Pontibaca salina]|uniref:Uncharacterized protein n=1 Tax=Pontibaca salina TaxID=2795731 RepID=A0A934M1H6_9RHOB|nr:hypothetical protein [Pontibaca salina]MBI6630808.1 hypothetical protein [Pontibaca salina]